LAAGKEVDYYGLFIAKTGENGKRVYNKLEGVCHSSLIQDVQRFIAVDADKPLMHRINHQVHCFKRQGADEYVFCVGYHHSGKRSTPVFPSYLN
jgi:hypothetical protein